MSVYSLNEKTLIEKTIKLAMIFTYDYFIRYEELRIVTKCNINS